MAQITEKRRPTLEELQSAPEIVLRLEVAQAAEDYPAVAQVAEAMLAGRQPITPEAVIALRQGKGS
jgi:hypothetical protein